MDELITPNPLPGTEQNVPASGSEGAGSETTVEVKELMKQVLNKEFPTNEAAIKSLKDTYDYAVQSGQKVKTLEQENQVLQAAQVTPELAKTVESLQAQVREANFYASNPQFNTPDAKALISKFGGNPDDVVKDEVFLKSFAALTKTAEMEQSQSVLHSNPRLGQAQDTMTKAKEALVGDHPNYEVANANAVAGVIEAFGMK